MDEAIQLALGCLPDPRPSIIELGADDYIASPFAARGEVDCVVLHEMFIMTPTQRFHWQQCWRQAVRQWVRQGYSPATIARTVWGETSPDDPH